MIHFSTDCVFSGKRGNYVETDISDSDDLYGRTKYLGEIGNAANVLTLRTSVIGHEMRNPVSLLEWFIAQNNRQVHGYTQAMYSGVTTNWLAEVVARIINQRLNGLYQVTSEAPVSKYELLSMIRDEYGLNIAIVPDDSFVCNRSMIGEKFKKTTGIVCPDWATLIQEMRDARWVHSRENGS